MVVRSWGSWVAVLVSVLPALAVGAVVQSTADAANPRAAGGQPSEREVRQIWLRDCAVCHGADGRGSDQGPDLEGVGRAGLDYVLRTGRMPIDEPDDPVRRASPAYDEPTIEALVEYGAELDDSALGQGPGIPSVEPSAGDVANGGRIWRLQCAACHRWSGDGGAIPGEIAPDVEPADPQEFGDAVRGGPRAMPRFGQTAIDDSELDDLAAYVAEGIDEAEDTGGWPLSHIGPVAEGAAAVVLGLGTLVLVSRALGTRERGHA